MCDLGTTADNFNPHVLYAIKAINENKLRPNYHYHNFTELSYVISGTVTYRINNSIHKLKKGDFLILNPGVYHEESLVLGEKVTELHLGFDNIYIKGLPKNFLLKENVSSVMHLKRNSREFDECINLIVEEQEKNEPGYDLILKSIAMKLVVMILRETNYVDENKEPGCCNFNSSEKSNVVQTIISYMKENYAEEISLAKMSKTTYLSPVYISKIFKEETGSSPINFLINIRLEIAKKLLSQGFLPVKTVAKNVGYDDAYYFSKLFKKYYGYPPSKVNEIEKIAR